MCCNHRPAPLYCTPYYSVRSHQAHLQSTSYIVRSMHGVGVSTPVCRKGKGSPDKCFCLLGLSSPFHCRRSLSKPEALATQAAAYVLSDAIGLGLGQEKGDCLFLARPSERRKLRQQRSADTNLQIPGVRTLSHTQRQNERHF